MIAWPKRQRPLSVVLHADELTALFQTFRRLKYRALFMTCYAAGFCINEPATCVLRISSGRHRDAHRCRPGSPLPLEQDFALHHRFRHVITNAVGGHEPGVQVEFHRIELEPDDTLLLCSAGLTEMVPDDRLAYQLPQKPRDFQFFCYLSEIIQPGSLG